MSNSSIWPTDWILSGATTTGQSGPGSDRNEEVLHIPQRSSITEALRSDCLIDFRWGYLTRLQPRTIGFLILALGFSYFVYVFVRYMIRILMIVL